MSNDDDRRMLDEAIAAGRVRHCRLGEAYVHDGGTAAQKAARKRTRTTAHRINSSVASRAPKMATVSIDAIRLASEGGEQ